MSYEPPIHDPRHDEDHYREQAEGDCPAATCSAGSVCERHPKHDYWNCRYHGLVGSPCVGCNATIKKPHRFVNNDGSYVRQNAEVRERQPSANENNYGGNGASLD